jgi:hypothetical protein
MKSLNVISLGLLSSVILTTSQSFALSNCISISNLMPQQVVNAQSSGTRQSAPEPNASVYVGSVFNEAVFPTECVVDEKQPYEMMKLSLNMLHGKDLDARRRIMKAILMVQENKVPEKSDVKLTAADKDIYQLLLVNMTEADKSAILKFKMTQDNKKLAAVTTKNPQSDYSTGRRLIVDPAKAKEESQDPGFKKSQISNYTGNRVQ